MVGIDGWCKKCDRSLTYEFDPIQSSVPDLICSHCYREFYSPEAIREKKLKQLLKKDFLTKLKSLFKK